MLIYCYPFYQELFFPELALLRLVILFILGLYDYSVTAAVEQLNDKNYNPPPVLFLFTYGFHLVEMNHCSCFLLFEH